MFFCYPPQFLNSDAVRSSWKPLKEFLSNSPSALQVKTLSGGERLQSLRFPFHRWIPFGWTVPWRSLEFGVERFPLTGNLLFIWSSQSRSYGSYMFLRSTMQFESRHVTVFFDGELEGDNCGGFKCFTYLLVSIPKGNADDLQKYWLGCP